MKPSCEQWAALTDCLALDEPVSDAERAFLVQHGRSCPLCATELAVWDGLGSLLVPAQKSADSAPPSRAVSSSKAVPTDVPARRAGLLRRHGGALALCAAAALLLGLAGSSLLRERTERPSAPRAPVAHVQPPAAVAPAAPSVPVVGAAVQLVVAQPGTVELDGKVAVQGADLTVGTELYARAGAACLAVEPGVRACLSQGGRLRVQTLSASERRLELLTGKLSAVLEPQPAGSSFGINTRAGTAVAIGTAFSVEVPALDGQVVTRVLHGTVMVRGRAGHELRLSAHRMAAMDGEASDLPAAEEARELAFVERPLAPEPNPALRAPGVSDSPPAQGKVSPNPLRSLRTAHTAPALAPVSASPSATDLLARAREARAKGDAEGALGAYRLLLDHYADSSEAHAARVPHGELLLAAGVPQRALDAFERYLEHGGALAQEASFGRARALRALGDRAAERAAIATFLQTYPDSPLCAVLRTRAQALGLL